MGVREPVTVRPDEGELRWGEDGALSRFPIAAGQVGGAYALLEDRVTRNDGVPLHRHPGDDEGFYVLEGELTFTLGDRPQFAASAGAFVFVPGEVVHSFRVSSDEARYLIITTPRHGEFYRAISRPAQSRDLPASAPMDMDVIMRACEEYGVEIVGDPPPFD